MAYQFHIDAFDNKRVDGWIYLAESPEQPVALDLLIDGRLEKKIIADIKRQDLTEAKIGGHGRCAFSAEFGDVVGMRSTPLLELKISGTDLTVAMQNGEVQRKTTSSFGGLWVDRADFLKEAIRRYNADLIPEHLFQHCMEFSVKGYTVFRGLIEDDIIDQINKDIDDIWETNSTSAIIETYQDGGVLKFLPALSKFKGGTNKLLDVYAFSEAARQAIFHRGISDFLNIIFEGPAVAFQSLSFIVGSEQPIHKDTCYVRITPETHLAASWIALEDVEAGTGELEYYVGSHRERDYIFGGKSKWSYLYESETDNCLASYQVDAERFGHKKERFLAKKGDVLIWHADLAHGGSPRIHPDKTRKSLVAHYGPQTAKVFYADSPHLSFSHGEQRFMSSVYIEQGGKIKSTL
ncbi:MAG: phytanoyl-CoA dioxygenase family protein [Bdellovibrionales bacterium]|nr:phytanoyl-CoA dioxygenase family protein [Bdellovibrionales bacterium]